jgi:hypothetical protein
VPWRAADPSPGPSTDALFAIASSQDGALLIFQPEQPRELSAPRDPFVLWLIAAAVPWGELPECDYLACRCAGWFLGKARVKTL